MNEEYWRRSRKIGDVVTQELSKGYCERNKDIIYSQVLNLPWKMLTEHKELPRSWDIYFIIDTESNLILYIGKATGEGFYGRWLLRIFLNGTIVATGIRNRTVGMNG